MMRRIVVIAIAAVIAVGSLTHVFAQKFTAEQYKKALWMVTRFYGGQRDGAGPNWLLMDHTYKTSFMRDGETEGIDLTGGWFDCGDNVLFGQTFFYTAYMLAKAYEAFPTGFHDLYHGFDYSDYAESADWSMAGGKPDGIPDLLQELKYATDWIIKATPDAQTFYYQKGNGGGSDDHKLWVTSGYKATQNRSDGGELDVPRPVCKNPNDATMAPLAAGALAIMSKIYRKYDAEYAAKCSTHAVNAYAYAASKKGQAAGSCFGGFYGAATGKAQFYLHIGAAEMFRLTGAAKYQEDMLTAPVTRNWAFDYQNPHDIAAYMSATVFTDNTQAHIDNMRTSYVQRYTTSLFAAGLSHGDSISNDGGQWGAMRYVGNHAFTVALYSNLTNTEDYDRFIHNQVDFILGKNRRDYSFLVGFDEHGGQMAQKPHHRNVFLNDENVEDLNSLTIPERNKYFGYMVGGHRDPTQYVDDVSSYTSTEGGLDYQAGLVGALAYIVSKLAPADTSKFGIPPEVIDSPDVSVANRVPASARQGCRMTVRPGNVAFSAVAGLNINSISVYNLQGRRVWNRSGSYQSINWQNSAAPRGIYLVRLKMSNGSIIQRNLMVK